MKFSYYWLEFYLIFFTMKAISFLVLILLTSCGNNSVNDKNIRFENEDSLKLKKLILSTIELPALQEFYNVQTTLNQNDIVVLASEYTIGVRFTDEFNRPIRILSREEIQNDSIKAYLDYKKILFSNDTAFVYYRYDVQGVGIETTYLYENSNWKLDKYKLWEN
jgi:hypothetical protein